MVAKHCKTNNDISLDYSLVNLHLFAASIEIISFVINWNNSYCLKTTYYVSNEQTNMSVVLNICDTKLKNSSLPSASYGVCIAEQRKCTVDSTVWRLHVRTRKSTSREGNSKASKCTLISNGISFVVFALTVRMHCKRYSISFVLWILSWNARSRDCWIELQFEPIHEIFKVQLPRFC